MIIVITNRNLPTIPQGGPVDIKVRDLGVNLGSKVDDNDRIYTGAFLPDEDGSEQIRTLTFQPKGSESEIFTKISQAELDKPWVVFVHGFHQDPLENIKKAEDIQNNHSVNVIAFSWPARPLDKTIGWDDAGIVSLKSALSGAGIISVLGAGLFAKAKSELEDKWLNYPPAIANAAQSKNDLVSAMEMIDTQMNLTKPPVLLVHSMGNYVLESTMKSVDELPMNFSNIILHEPDVTVPGYEWVEGLNKSLGKSDSSRLYITNNEEDYVLLASKLRRFILKKQGELPKKASTERLGRYIGKHILGEIHYVDFTFGEFIDDEHEFFKLAKSSTNPHVFELLGRIFRAEDDGLPSGNSESSSGFSKMPTDAHRYQLEKIIHVTDVDLPRDEFTLVDSLNEFDNSDRVTFEWEDDYDEF